jgi:hypothetical protein
MNEVAPLQPLLKGAQMVSQMRAVCTEVEEVVVDKENTLDRDKMDTLNA